ncbi:MAG: DsbA family protein [Acidimicrobiales bacterium]
MSSVVEVFADINCPFTHVGLKRVTAELTKIGSDAQVWVRAWPLEWVNGEPLDAGGVTTKAEALTKYLGVDDFTGFDPSQWPTSTIPALNLAASGYEVDLDTGLKVSLELRAELFERGRDVGDPEVLSAIAAKHNLPAPSTEASQSIHDDYAEGQRRGVSGSPHFWASGEEFFCPSLDLGHDSEGHLTAQFDPEGLNNFMAKLKAAS